MALLYITEFQNAGIQAGDGMGVVLGDTNMVSQTPISTAAGSVQSATFANNTTLVRLHNDSTSPCSILFGTNPTATTSNSRMAANQTEYYAIPQNSGMKVAVINNV